MKGIELPISTIIVIILVLIVLLAVLGLFYGVWPNGTQSVNLESAKDNACQILVSIRCLSDPSTIPISNFDADKDGYIGTADTGSGWVWGTATCGGAMATNGDNLAALCDCYYNAHTLVDCETNVCGC